MIKFHFSIVWMAAALIFQGHAQNVTTPPDDGNNTVIPLDAVLKDFVDVLPGVTKVVAGKMLTDVVDAVFPEIKGSDVADVVNCNGIPLGLETSYRLGRFLDISSFFADDSDGAPAESMRSAVPLLPNEDSLIILRDDGSLPDGSLPTDNCTPYTRNAIEARAVADGTTEEIAVACEPTNGAECCGESTCVANKCSVICLEEGAQCFADIQCACLGNNFECAADDASQDRADAEKGDPKDPDRFAGTCQQKSGLINLPAAIPPGFTPICVVFNEDMFAIRFLPAFIPIINTPVKKWPCSVLEGLPLADIAKLNSVLTLQFVGMGMIFGDREQNQDMNLPNMRYGSSGTTGPQTLNPPTLYDGLTNIPLFVDKIDFWISIQLRLLSKIKYEFDKAACLKQFPRPVPDFFSKIELNMKIELYIQASTTPCVLAVIPSIEAKISIIPTINIGSGIGGYCRSPGNRCVPDGAFVNIKVAPKIPGLSGIAESVLGIDPAASNLGAKGASFGFFQDKVTGMPIGALLKTYIEAPEFLGISLGSGFDTEYQYFTNEELERRRWTITTNDYNATSDTWTARCPAYEDCKTWKPYKLVDASGEEQVENGEIVYPDHYICADIFEDESSNTGVGPFNRQLFAKVPINSDQRNEKIPNPNEWHVQDWYQGYDMFTISVQVSNLEFALFRLKLLRFSMVLFGDIQPAIDPNGYPDEGTRLKACEQAAVNDGLFVFMEIEASISVLFLVSFEGRLQVGNVPVTPGSGIPISVENPNMWLLDARATVSVLGMTLKVIASGEWFFVSANRRRRLQDATDPCADPLRRKLEESDENLQRALLGSVSIDDAEFEYSITMSCNSFEECLEDIGEFVLQELKQVYNEIVKVVDKVVEFAIIAIAAVEDFVNDALVWLNDFLDFAGKRFEELWEEFGGIWDAGVAKFDEIGSNGFQFSDLADYGQALLDGGIKLFESANRFLVDVLNIGIGRKRGVGNRPTGERNPFGCPLYINRIEVCNVCLIFGCLGCREEDQGPPYPLKECVEEVARNVAEAESLKNDADLLRVEYTNELENENNGFYTTFNETCRGDAFQDCPVTTPAFMVAQMIDKDGNPTRPTNMNLQGQTLQKDSSGTINANENYITPLDFSADERRRRLQETDDCEEQIGTGICKETFVGIDNWYKKDAREEAARFAQGTAMGLNSAVYNKYATEQDWAHPTITFGDPSYAADSVFQLELGCDDERLLQDGMPLISLILQTARMQELVLATGMPGTSITFAVELRNEGRTTFKPNWTTIKIEESCLVDFVTMGYSIMDDTGKRSNELKFQFDVVVKPPKIEIKGPAETKFGCNEAASITALADAPSITGGCLEPTAFGKLKFTDDVSIDLTSNSCSGYTVSRAWSILPPSNVSSLENFGDENCPASLASLAGSAMETFTGVTCDPEPFVVPQVCKESPFRIAGYEDFSQGFPRLDLLPNGRDSFNNEAFLADVVMGETAKIVFANGGSMKKKSANIVDGSMFTLTSKGGGGLIEVTSLVEELFYLDSDSQKGSKRGSGKGSNKGDISPSPTRTALPTKHFSVPSPRPSFVPRPVGSAKELTNMGVDPTLPLMECQGDCDNDSDCGPGLYCFQRNAMTSVPGCEGGESDGTSTDYCTFRDLPSDSSSSKGGKGAPQAQKYGPTIKHTAFSPQAMRGYSELCNEFVGFEVDIGGEIGHICFHAECSSGGPLRPMDSIAVQSRLSLDARTEQLQVEEMMDKLKNGPRVTTWKDGRATTREVY